MYVHAAIAYRHIKAPKRNGDFLLCSKGDDMSGISNVPVLYSLFNKICLASKSSEEKIVLETVLSRMKLIRVLMLKFVSSLSFVLQMYGLSLI